MPLGCVQLHEFSAWVYGEVKKELTRFLFVHILLAFPLSQNFNDILEKNTFMYLVVIMSFTHLLWSCSHPCKTFFSEAVCKFFVLGFLLTAMSATGVAVPQLGQPSLTCSEPSWDDSSNLRENKDVLVHNAPTSSA